MNENSETIELPVTDSICRPNCFLRIGVKDRGRGAPKGRVQVARALPLGPKKHHICSVSFVKLSDFRLCNTCSKAFCYVEEPRKPVACLRANVTFIFLTVLATIYENFCSGPPLEKILGAPLDRGAGQGYGTGIRNEYMIQ